MKIEVEVPADSPREGREVTALTWGHITVSDGATTFTSKGHSPDRSLLLLPSLTDLLAGLAAFLTNERQKKHVFEATPSGLTLAFEKRKHGYVYITSGGREAILTDRAILILAVHRAVSEVRLPVPENGDMNSLNELDRDIVSAYQDGLKAFVAVLETAT